MVSLSDCFFRKVYPVVKLPSQDLADVTTIGIPRGFLYYRYGNLWKTFFESLGRSVVISAETDKAIVEAGTLISVDECCLASKAFMGHAESLIGRCDALFIPCYASHNPRAGFCTKFQSITDLACNTFRDNDIKIVSLLVEDASDKKKMRNAYFDLAFRLGAGPAETRRAWNQAVQVHECACSHRAALQEDALEALAKQRENAATSGARPLGILLVAHPYISHDRYLCGAITDALERMGATVLFADETNHDKAYKKSFEFSSTLPWRINRELIGSILMLQDSIDGIVLVSAFPCGPDSMTDDAIMRCIQGTPILNLMIDAQSGTAGVETRIESFVDILRFQQQGGYVRG